MSELQVSLKSSDRQNKDKAFPWITKKYGGGLLSYMDNSLKHDLKLNSATSSLGRSQYRNYVYPVGDSEQELYSTAMNHSSSKSYLLYPDSQPHKAMAHLCETPSVFKRPA